VNFGPDVFSVEALTVARPTTHVRCLNLAANAIITWNTVYMAETLDAIRDEGVAVDDDGATLPSSN
jgi:hypothetical protein